MKKFVIAAIMLFAVSVNCVYAQSFVQKGNDFSLVSSNRSAKDTLSTQYNFIDNKGNKYPIVINRQNGRCYIWKASGKTGKLYKQYLKEDISREICKQLGVTYTEKKKQ